MAEIHMAVTRQVKPGCEADFEVILQEFARQSMNCEGMAGIHILRPLAGSGSREYGILRSFETQSDADKFYASALFAEWSSSVAPLVDGHPIRRKLHGLEAFFRNGQKATPPRWKMAIVTYLGVFPAVLLWSRILPSWLGGVPPIAVSAIMNAFVVATLTWVVMPALTKVFDAWLHGDSIRSSGAART